MRKVNIDLHPAWWRDRKVLRNAWRNAALSNLNTSVVSHWKLEEASGTRADELGANSMAAVNTPNNAAGKIGNAVNLVAASTQYLQKVTATGLPNTTDNWSWACWVNPTGFGAYRAIMNHVSAGDQKCYFLLETGTGNFYRWSGLNGGAVSAGVWTHLAYTFTSGGVNTGTERIYRNGSLTNSRTGAVPAPASGNLFIGSAQAGLLPFDGQIDEMTLWVGRVLDLGEIQRLYNGGSGISYPFT